MRNKLRTVAAIGALVGIVGCAAGDGGTTALVQMSGNARVVLDRNNPNALSVVMLNVRDLGYDFNDASARAAFINRMLSDQCGTPVIKETRVTRTGGTSMRAFQSFTIDVDCPNGASQVVP